MQIIIISTLNIHYGCLQIMMVRHRIFNFSTNLTSEKCSLSEYWDLGIFNCRLEKKILSFRSGLIFSPKYWQMRALARRLRAKIVLFRIQAWNFSHLLRLVSWWFLDIEPLRQISTAHAHGKIHLRYRKFGLTWLCRPIFAFNMVKNRPTISLDVLKDINKYFEIVFIITHAQTNLYFGLCRLMMSKR